MKDMPLTEKFRIREVTRYLNQLKSNLRYKIEFKKLTKLILENPKSTYKEQKRLLFITKKMRWINHEIERFRTDDLNTIY